MERTFRRSVNIYHVTLTFDPLTLNTGSVSAVSDMIRICTNYFAIQTTLQLERVQNI